MMKLWSLLHDAPELKTGSMLPLELFAVVLIENHSGNHNYPVNKPLIVTGKDGYLWNPPDGTVNSWKFMPVDKPRYATDEEVEQCIKDLTPVQWQKFRTFEVFLPIQDAAMNRSVMVENDETGRNNGDDNEIELADGRKITVSSE